MIETVSIRVGADVVLSCRTAGPAGGPAIVFLHGFPEAAFVWDRLVGHFADRYRCVAPNLRGYERSSAPPEVDAYRARHLVADVAGLIAALGGRVAAVVAHDWGGAVAWNLAAARPELLERLVIVNSPHPATFLRALQSDPAQQQASAYMNFLARPDAAALLAENDYARLWPFFTGMGAADPSHPGGGWLTAAVRERYREVWGMGLAGPCRYYAASPMRPPTAADRSVLDIRLPRELTSVRVPTRVVWAEADIALPPALLDGLGAWVPDLVVARVPEATHWIVHEQPERVAAEIEAALGR